MEKTYTCITCKQSKPVSEFYRHSRPTVKKCKTCHNVYMAQYRERHPAMRAYNRVWVRLKRARLSLEARGFRIVDNERDEHVCAGKTYEEYLRENAFRRRANGINTRAL